METKTASEYKEVIDFCKEIFKKKTQDYGTSWRILRLPSITDQILIKARRIRSIQEKGNQKVEDSLQEEFVGIINYCLIGLIQMGMSDEDSLEIPYGQLEPAYDKWVQSTMDLLEDKNHDYGEAWRLMRISSITDIILMKLYRVKQIEDNEGRTIISEGITANYQDIINYAVFCLIKMNKEKYD